MCKSFNFTLFLQSRRVQMPILQLKINILGIFLVQYQKKYIFLLKFWQDKFPIIFFNTFFKRKRQKCTPIEASLIKICNASITLLIKNIKENEKRLE